MPASHSTEYYNQYHYVRIILLPSCSDILTGCSSYQKANSHFQGCSDTHRHLVGSHPQHHPYCILLHKFWRIMHDSSLAGMSSQSCSIMLYHVQSSQCTTIQYTPSSHFEAKLSWMPYQHTWLSFHAATHIAHITPMAEQCTNLVVHCCHAGTASKSNAIRYK